MEVKFHSKIKNIRSEKALLEKVLKKLDKKTFRNTKKKVFLSVHFVGDRKMKALKKHHFGIDQTTDVLSFPVLTPDLWKVVAELDLGSIIINFPMAKRMEKTYGIKSQKVLLCYLIHGFTHILGLDHEVDPKKFFKKENELKKLLNVKLDLHKLL